MEWRVTRKASTLALTALMVAAVLQFAAPTGAAAAGSESAPQLTCNAWGASSYGQLGNGTNDDSNTPVRISGLSGAVAVSGGGYHSMALMNDGTVRTWGWNKYGQLGNGTNNDSNTPVRISGLSGAVAVSGGYYHSLALMSDGTVWAWGYDSQGQLGDGTNNDSNIPVAVSGLTGVVAVSAGGLHSLALMSDGTVWAWGYNGFGGLGDGTNNDCNTPVEVSGLSGVVAVSAGGAFSLALMSDGTVWAWGRNLYSELGDGTNNDSNTPVKISGLSGVVAVSAGFYHSLALKSDGTVWVWGRNIYGELGDGTNNDSNTPVKVSGLSGVVAVSGGSVHSLALKSDGTVWAWGCNSQGQLGDGTNNDSNIPVAVSGLIGGFAIEAGGRHSLALSAPTITSLSPDHITAESPGFTLTVNGAGFLKDSVVRWNGVSRTATYVSGSQLKAFIPSGDVACVGTAAITVLNPGGEGGISNEKTFTVRAPATWYLAEGSTSWGFDTFISIQNPNTSAVNATITYMPMGEENVVKTVTLPATSQTTVNPRDTLGSKDFSTVVTCTDPTKGIAVDRTMIWTGPGAASPEAHSSIGVTSPWKTWYLTEGSSAWGFECWLLVQNPNPATANITLNYMIEGEGPKSVSHQVDPNSRATFEMSKDIGSKDASVQVASDLPVIAERAMYRDNRREGHCSIGTTTPAKDFYLAEGTTDYGFTTYVLVQNPNNSPTDVTITYMTPGGPRPQGAFTMPANSRKTVRVNDVGEVTKTDFSTRVHGTLPIIAERAMYWGVDTPLGEACHDSIGMASPHTAFYLPDGESRAGPGATETWTLVQNPNDTDVNIEMTYMTPTGLGNVTFPAVVKAYSRSTFNMSDKLEGRASILVTSKTAGKKIIVERAMYWNDRGAGTDTMGGYGD